MHNGMIEINGGLFRMDLLKDGIFLYPDDTKLRQLVLVGRNNLLDVVKVLNFIEDNIVKFEGEYLTCNFKELAKLNGQSEPEIYLLSFEVNKPTKE